MPKLGLLVIVTAKPGLEGQVAEFLKSALPMAQAEPATNSWYALQINEAQFGIFDTFDDEAGREAHLNGDIAKALMAKSDELLSEPPNIQKVDLLAVK
ncbi:MAG: putative quinol monooxygenase [Candidatus Saccharimonadales bacterium]